MITIFSQINGLYSKVQIHWMMKKQQVSLLA